MWNWIKKNDYWFALIGAFECLGISSLEIFDKSLLTISNKGLFSLFLIGYILFCVLFAYFSLNFWKGIKWTDWLSEDPVRYYSLFAVLALFIIIPIGIAAGINYKEDVVVELHGLIADLIVFGVLLALYDFFRQRSSDIKRYLREIDHYGGWEEKEATYRIIGLLRHLSNLKYKGVKLYKAYLKDAVLNDSIGYHTTVPVHGVSGGIIFRAVDLREATILKSNFENADANGINFQGAQLIESSFREIDATKANMSECTISNCSFFNANLSEVNFSNARFYFNNFDNTDFTDTNLDGVKVYAPSNTTDWIAFLKSRVKAGETYLENNFYSEEIGFEEIDPKNAEFYKKYAKLKAFIIKRKTQNNT